MFFFFKWDTIKKNVSSFVWTCFGFQDFYCAEVALSLLLLYGLVLLSHAVLDILVLGATRLDMIFAQVKKSCAALNAACA